MNISAEEKNRYLREAEVVLAREGFLTDRIRTGGLRVLLDGLPLCEVPESGGVTYRMADISTPERVAAKDKVYRIVRAVTEYMYQMERAPILKVDGLEDTRRRRRGSVASWSNGGPTTAPTAPVPEPSSLPSARTSMGCT